jgi:hypothetical protein
MHPRVGNHIQPMAELTVEVVEIEEGAADSRCPRRGQRRHSVAGGLARNAADSLQSGAMTAKKSLQIPTDDEARSDHPMSSLAPSRAAR